MTRFALRTVLCAVLWPALAPAADLPKVYQHPAGFSIRMPADWQTQEGDGSLNLAPPGGDTESYFLLADPAQGLREPNDPQVIAGLDEQVKGLAPYLQRQNNGTPIATGVGQGVVLVWSGNNPNGQQVQFKVYAAIAADHLVQMTAVGPAASLAARQPIVDAIFASLSTGGAAPPAAGGNPMGGNPLGGAAADPWAGKFAGDGFVLELSGNQGQYRGTLTANGQTFPVTAEPRGTTLYGSFTAGGAQYMFSAKLQGDTLEVTSDGNTHRLQRQGGAPAAPTGGNNPLGGNTPAAQQGQFSGTYVCQVQNGVNRLQLNQQGQQVTGTLTLAAGATWKVEAQVDGGVLKGFAADDQGALYFEGQLAGGALTLTFMEFDDQAKQPKRETGRQMPFQREGGATQPQPQVQPQVQPQPQVRPQANQGGPLQGKPLQANVVYNAGERIAMQACGVGFAVPANFRAQFPENGAGVVMGDGQGRLVVVSGAAITPDAPSAQQLLQEFVAQVAQPSVLGEGYQIGLAAEPQVAGTQVVVQLQGTGPAGAISGHVIGVCNPNGPNEALVVAFGAAGDASVRQTAEAVAQSFSFGAPQVDISTWYQQLVGHSLVNQGGAYNRTSPNSTLNQDNQTTIQLSPDGRFVYQYRAMGIISTPGGMAANYDNNETSRGRFRFFVGPTGPALILLPDEQGKEVRSYDLAVEGNQLMMNGAAFSVN